VKDHQTKAEFERIYFYHIRKAGGQSIYHAILEKLCGVDSFTIENWLTRANIMFCDGKPIIGWDDKQINRGDFYFAFSHHAMHELLPMPDDTFAFTCFRDPVPRVVSHYRMLKSFREMEIRGDVLKAEAQWAKDNFSEFLDNLPQRHLMNQLWMFSAEYDPEEALENASKLSYFFFLDKFSVGLSKLSNLIGIELEEKHIMVSTSEFAMKPEEGERLQELLIPEYQFYEGLQELWK